MASTQKRPTKRRRTKRLVEDEDEAADGIAVQTIINQTDTGPVVERHEHPMWSNPPINDRPVETQVEPSMDIPLDQEDHYDSHQSGSPERHSRSQNDYIEEFSERIIPFLYALLSREAMPRTDTCGRCSKAARWRCRDCTLGQILCRGCMRNQHMECPLHRIEVWTGSYFRRAELWEVGVYILLPHHSDPALCPTLQSQESVLAKFQQNRDEAEQLNQCQAGEPGPGLRNEFSGDRGYDRSMDEDVIWTGDSGDHMI
jgi:hypothetical protein